MEFKTGQFITLYWPDTTNYKRAYSLSSCALDRGFYEVTVKRDGKMGTRIVDWAKVGDKMFVIPPVGKFLPVFEKELVCIAGGSGVTIGTVKLVDGDTIYVQTADGNVVTVKTDSKTTVSTAKKGKVSDVKAGQSVTVQGAAGTDGTVTATSVTAQPK